jgi:hypothetical protein
MGTEVYLGCGHLLAAAVVRRVAGVPIITPRRAAPRRGPDGRGTERGSRVRGTVATGATIAAAQSAAHGQGVCDGGVVAHLRGWGGSPATAPREENARGLGV